MPKQASATLEEASNLLHSIAEAGPRRNTKGTIASISRKLGWGFRRTRTIWYREARRIDADEMDTLRREAKALANRYASIAKVMENLDPSFYGADIASLVSAARALGGSPNGG